MMKMKVKIDTTLRVKIHFETKPDWPIIPDKRFLLSVGIGSEIPIPTSKF